MDSLVYHILKKKPIVEYLERKGHRPVKMLSGGRLSYLCPFPDHRETKPSFMVWTDSEFENFHCFGCQRGYSIIHIVAGLEGISYKQAVQTLSDGVEVSLEEDVRLQLEFLDKKLSSENERASIAEKLLAIGTRCRYYLESVDYKDSEVGIVDRFYEELDRLVLDLDFDAVDECFENLSPILRLRRDKFECISRDALRKQYQEQE